MVARSSTVVACCALVCFAVACCAMACSPFSTAGDAAAPAEAGKDDAENGAESGADGSGQPDASVVDADVAPDAQDAGPLIVFATATKYTGDLMGAAGADTICSNAAHAAGFPTSTKFVAWLSTSVKSAAARLAGDGPWYVPQTNLLPGALVALNKTQLLLGQLAGPINKDENGNTVASLVWTGTLAGGQRSLLTCADWVPGGTNGRVGASDQIDSRWTSYMDLGCVGSSFPVYCFQVP
jgi:hypothetical protein